jgi:hypothetical protein
MKKKIDKLILGHNQFFGISHLSSERAIKWEQYFNDINNIVEIIEYSFQKGGKGLMLSTHFRAQEVIRVLAQKKELAKNLNLYILLPYMAKYVRLANEKGLVKMGIDMLKQPGWSKSLNIGLKVSIGTIRKKILPQLQALIDIELLPFKDLNIKAVFLHNSLTDLAVALEMGEIIEFFSQYIEEEYKAYPGFCTLSYGLIMKYFEQQNFKNPLVMAPFNPVGFQMNPSKKICEQLLAKIPSQTIAMSTLAAGHVAPDKGASYLAGLSKIRSAVIGASSKRHIDETFKIYLSTF